MQNIKPERYIENTVNAINRMIKAGDELALHMMAGFMADIADTVFEESIRCGQPLNGLDDTPYMKTVLACLPAAKNWNGDVVRTLVKQSSDAMTVLMLAENKIAGQG